MFITSKIFESDKQITICDLKSSRKREVTTFERDCALRIIFNLKVQHKKYHNLKAQI